MIRDRRVIGIKASSKEVFDLIDRMPNKFPIYKFLEAKPFFILRILLVDGIKSAMEALKIDRSSNELRLSLNDKMGPFTLIELERPKRYWFLLEFIFFNCKTGYSLISYNHETELSFDLIAENPSLGERVWWIIFKPFHGLFANKVLSIIKEMAEHNHRLVSDAGSNAAV